MAAQDLPWAHAQAFLIVLLTDRLNGRQTGAVSKAGQMPVKSAEDLSVEETSAAAEREVPGVEDPVADGVAEETMLLPLDTACSLSQSPSDEYIGSSNHGGMKDV
jgi:hypothetical protein